MNETKRSPSRATVRRWMGLHATEHQTATALVESCNASLDLPAGWLDDATHWVWDLALDAIGSEP